MALNNHLSSPLRRSGYLRPRIELSSISAVVTVVTAMVTAMTIATIAIVLGRVVVWRVDWCRWGGWRIQANDTATVFTAVVGEHDGSADDAVFASKVLQESRLRERFFHKISDSSRRLIIRRDSKVSQRASFLRVCDMRILQGVEHWTSVVARKWWTGHICNTEVSVLVDGKREDVSVVTATSGVHKIALDLNRVAWELAEFDFVSVTLSRRRIDNASGVDGGAELGGNVRNLGSRVLERIVGVVWLMVVVFGAVRVVGSGDASVSRRRRLVALGLRVLRCVVSALRLVVRGGLVGVRWLMRGVGWLMGGVGWPMGGVGKSTVLESAGSRGKNGESETLHYDFIFSVNRDKKLDAFKHFWC